jgi:hypothetical protein
MRKDIKAGGRHSCVEYKANTKPTREALNNLKNNGPYM